jgi:hypothetical protein
MEPGPAVKIILIAAFCIFPACAIASVTDLEAQADQLRDAAMARFEHDDRAGALRLNKQALKVTRHLPETSWRTIENYDDAGLYYFSGGKWKTSAQHQAIAVLLSCGIAETQSMYPTYVERLGWALAKYRPHQDFGPIAENPLLLLKDIRLNVRANYDLRRRYFKTIKVRDTPAGSPARYIYKLRPETVPESCYPAHEPAPGTALQLAADTISRADGAGILGRIL